jgi:hypothetical protein
LQRSIARESPAPATAYLPPLTAGKAEAINMVENVSSRRGSAGGRTTKLSLESLEDRTNPVIVGANGVALDPVAISQSGPIDRAYLAESARLSLLQAGIGALEAAQGSNASFRQFGSQLAAQEITFFNQVFPALAPAGATLQLTQFDLQLVNSFPGLTPAQMDSQFIALSALYSLQSHTLAQAETVLGSSPTVRTVAQEEFAGTQQELLAEATLLGSANSLALLNLFGFMGSFDSIGVPGLVAAGQTTTFGTTFSPNGGFGPSSTVGVGTSTGFGSGASFGMSTGFGPSTTAGGSSTNGFGPNSSFGTSGGFGPDSGF